MNRGMVSPAMHGVWKRWRTAFLLVAAFLSVDLLLVVVFSLASDRRPAAPEPPAARAEVLAAPSARPGLPPGALSAPPPAPPPRPPASASAAPARALWPEPKPIEGVSAVWDPSHGDPFESDAGLPRDVRVLVRVGAFRVGITNDSRMLDEKATLAILGELGAEIDQKDRDRTDAFEQRIVEYQEIFQKYRGRLAPHMTGSFALKGNGWSDTEPLTLPEHPHHEPHGGH